MRYACTLYLTWLQQYAQYYIRNPDIYTHTLIWLILVWCRQTFSLNLIQIWCSKWMFHTIIIIIFDWCMCLWLEIGCIELFFKLPDLPASILDRLTPLQWHKYNLNQSNCMFHSKQEQRLWMKCNYRVAGVNIWNLIGTADTSRWIVATLVL